MRTVKIDYSSGSPKVSYDGSAIGIQGEHRASELVIIPPPDMPSGLEYRLAFDPGGMSDTLSLTDGELRYELPQSITRHEVVSMNIEGYEGADRIYKSVMVELYFDEAVDTDNPVDADGHSIGAEVAENTAARHTHSNKETLDKFGETDGQPTYNGEPIGGGGGDDNGIFKIPMTLTALEDGIYTVECATTKAEIQAAYAAGKTLEVVATDNVNNRVMVIPLLYTVDGVYVFSATGGIQAVFYIDEGDDGLWEVTVVSGVSAEEVGFSNATYPDLTTVNAALIKALPRLVETTRGTVSLTLADNTEYRLTNAQDVMVLYPNTSFESWIKVTFAETGTYIFRLPSTSKYIGTAPTFGNGETWEISIKDGVVIAQKVGDGV